jgi:hypothetical protein
VPHLHCDTVLAPELHVGGGGSAHVFDDAVHFCPALQFWLKKIVSEKKKLN